MIPANLKLDIYRGDDFNLVFRMKDGATNTYVNLTGRTARAQIRSTADDPVVLATFTCTILDQTASPGGVLLTLSPAITAALPLEGGVYDVELADTGRTWVRTPLAGTVNVLPEVTR